MNQKIYKKKKKKKAYFQNFSWFWFCIFKLCMIMCDSCLLCWIKSFKKIALISYYDDPSFSPTPLGKLLLIGELWKYAQKKKKKKKSSLENFESALYSTSVSMPLINVACRLAACGCLRNDLSEAFRIKSFGEMFKWSFGIKTIQKN